MYYSHSNNLAGSSKARIFIKFVMLRILLWFMLRDLTTKALKFDQRLHNLWFNTETTDKRDKTK